MSHYVEPYDPAPVSTDRRAASADWQLDQEEDGLDWGRYLAALRRHWLLIVLCSLLGGGAAFLAYRSVAPRYSVEGTIWVTNEGRSRQGGPIQQGELLYSSSWIELLLSFEVLEPVARSEKLYLGHSPDYERFFTDFTIGDTVRADRYALSLSGDGSELVLTGQAEDTVDTAPLGSTIGQDLGFRWSPPAPPPGETVPFSVVTPRTAAIGLREALQPDMDPMGTFIGLELEGRNPERITSILRAVMERYVEVASRFKRLRLDELNSILAEQLDSARTELQEAERELEDFRVQTITLPSDESLPIAAGLQQTQAPVMSDFFQRRLRLDELDAAIARLEAALEPDSGGNVRLQPLEGIPAVNESSEMQEALTEVAAARAELRALRDLYTDDYADVRETAERLETLEREIVPNIGAQILQDLRRERQAIADMVDERAQELQQIPTRAIEEARLQRRAEIADNIYRQVRDRFEGTALAAVSSTPDVRILDMPQVPARPIDDERARWALLAFLTFVGLGVGGAIVLDRFDGRLRYPTEVSDDLGLPILGVIPRIRLGARGNSAQVREAFRELRVHLEYAYGSGSPLMVAVTSPTEEEGKTTVAANLGMAFAGLGRNTLVVDGDTRRGDLHTLLGCDRKPGLTDYLKGTGDVVQATNQENLFLMSSGARDSRSPDLLSSNRMLSLSAAMKQRYEVVIFDCPPLMAGGDAFVLGAHAGNVLMVVRSGSSRKDLVAAKLDDFLRLPVRILGAVLNDASPKNSFGAYAYYGEYLPGYEAQDEEEDAPDPAPRPTRALSGD